MKALVGWIRKGPIIAFYVICFAISWAFWLPLILSRNDLSEVTAIVGLFGPALACVIVSRGTSSPPRESRPIRFWISFIAGWFVSTLAFVVYNDAATSPVVWVVFAVLALIPAYIIASVASRLSGLRSKQSPARPKGWWVWYIVAVVLPLVLRLVSVWLSRLIGWGFESDPQLPSSQIELAGSVLVVFLYTMIWAGGLNEETGWTGLALPRLQAKFSPLVSTLIVWALWMLWHVPLHLSGYFNLSAHVLIGSFCGRFLLTWLFIRSSGEWPTALLLHTSVNVTSQFVPLTYASLLVDAAVALLVIIGGRMWRRLPKEHSAVHAEEPLAA
jgi:membrane protease YdiL (CAAX protease family)